MNHVRLDRVARRVVAGEAERALDGTLASTLPEAFARSLVRHRVVDRMLRELESDGRWEENLDVLADRIAQSPALKRALREVLSSPEVREALTTQATDFGGEIAQVIRVRGRRADDGLSVRSPDPAFGGLGTRGVAFAVDAVLVQALFAVLAGSAALVLSFLIPFHHGLVPGILGGIAWAACIAAYFVAFWTTTGQTPGLRLTGGRVVTADGLPVSASRAALRLVLLVLAILPLGAGLVPIAFDRQRRGLHDMLARTLVLRV